MFTINWKIALGVGVFITGVFVGWYPTHNIYVTYKATVQQAAADQKRDSDAKDKLAKENADAKQSEFVEVIKKQDGYYRDHPVIRVQYADGKCSVSEAASNPKGANGTTTIDNATAFISPYNPQATENVAARLDMLQKLLVKDGVLVE